MLKGRRPLPHLVRNAVGLFVDSLFSADRFFCITVLERAVHDFLHVGFILLRQLLITAATWIMIWQFFGNVKFFVDEVTFFGNLEQIPVKRNGFARPCVRLR